MKIFVDSANLTDIEEALQRGFPAGITTNPSILSKEERTDFSRHVRNIIEIIERYEYNVPLSVEVLTTDWREMITQAEFFVEQFGGYENLTVKVPIGWDELKVIRELRRRDIKVNCTACMSYNQAIMAANAGANFVSLFWGRIRDIGYDAGSIVRQVRTTFREWNCPSQIIVGSIRHIADVNEAIQAGADIVTVPPKFFRQLVSHPKTDEAVEQFISDFRGWAYTEETPTLERLLAPSA
jgi:transaldolase